MKTLFTKVFYIVSAIILLIGAALPARAQLFSKTILESGKDYTAMTSDISNNVYVVRVTSGTGGTSGEVAKYTGGTGTPNIIYTGLHEGDDTGPGGDLPWGIVVATNGTVYVTTDFVQGGGTGNIIRLTPNTGNTSGTVYTPFTFQSGNFYTALAIDAANNIYTTEFDSGNNVYAIAKYTPGGTRTQLYDHLTNLPGYSYPTGLAVASNGDIYVTDAFSETGAADGGHIYLLTAGSGYSFAGKIAISTGKYATALTLDASGNLYTIENTGSGSAGYVLLKYTNGTGTPTQLYNPLHDNGIYYPWGIVYFNPETIFVNDGDDGSDGGAVLKLLSSDATLSGLTISSGTLNPVFATGTTSYTDPVTNATTGVTVTPTTTDAGATIKVNTVVVTSGSQSQNISLPVGTTNVNTVVTAFDGVTTKTYTIAVTRAASSVATLSNLVVARMKNGNRSTAILNPAFDPATFNYSIDAPNSTSQITLTPTVTDATATIKVNGTTVPSGSATANITLNVGPNTITTVVTAQDGTTKDTYTLGVDRRDAMGNLNGFYSPISVNLAPALHLNGDEILVHPALSPNGDGINDVFTIEGLQAYPQNKVTIMNRDGVVVFQAEGYDNSTKVFDGHSNISGSLQEAGTYFYTLDYNAAGISKHKTGYLILKY